MCEGMGDIGSRLFGGGEGGGGFGGGGTAAADPVPTPTPATPPTPGGDPAGGAPAPGAAPGAVPGAPTDPAAAGAAPPNPAARTFGQPGVTPPAENPQHHFGNMLQGLLRQLIGPQAGGMPGSGATPIAGSGAFSQFFNGATGGARRFGGPGAPGGAPAPAAAGAGGEAPPAPAPGGGALPSVQGQNPFAGLMQLLSGFGAGGAGGGAGVR